MPLSELVQRLNTAGRVNEYGCPFTAETLEQVLTEDEELQTNGLLSDAEIIEMVEEEGKPSEENLDEEPEQDPPRKYSYKEAMEAMQIDEGFFQYQQDKEAEEMHHYALKMQSWAIRHPPKSSRTSLEFFL